MSATPHEMPGAIPWSRVATAALALLVGFLLGFFGITRGFGPPSNEVGVSQERYSTLAATLYAEGESLDVVQKHVAALGKADPAAFLLQLADRYGKSGERVKMRQADELRLLGRALQEAGPVAPAAAGAIAPAQPVSRATPAPEAIAGGQTVLPALGLIKGQGVRVRAEPSTKAPALALIRDGEEVEILNVVEGEVVQGGEKRWYKVRSGQTIGYVYYVLIVPAD